MNIPQSAVIIKKVLLGWSTMTCSDGQFEDQSKPELKNKIRTLQPIYMPTFSLNLPGNHILTRPDDAEWNLHWLHPIAIASLSVGLLVKIGCL